MLALTDPDPKRRLLEAVISYLAERGVGQTSMREIGAAVGSSHRMLGYHFGSRDDLLREVSREIERQQRERFEALVADNSLTPVQVMERMSAGVTDPELAPYEVLFFELYAISLRNEGDPFAQDAVNRWLRPVAALFERLGMSKPEADAEARLAIAVSRGVLLDLLATGDREAVGAAAERYFARYR